jgi:lysyl-tRNA synthetase class 2
MDEFLQFILACPPLIKKTYQQVFMETVAIDPLTASLVDLRAAVARCSLGNVLGEETMRDPYLFLLMSHVVEPALAKEGRPVAVYDFPVSQAALAEVEGDVAHRFEVYYQGVELANGFHELTDPKAQQQRFDADNALRQTLGLSPCAIDPYFLAALNHGLPPCSGVALGIDRLLVIALQKTCLAEVQAFDHLRA